MAAKLIGGSDRAESLAHPVRTPDASASAVAAGRKFRRRIDSCLFRFEHIVIPFRSIYCISVFFSWPAPGFGVVDHASPESRR